MPDSLQTRMDLAWLSQEAAREGRGGDAADQLVAQALARPLPMQLPADFALALALEVARRTTPSPLVEWIFSAVAAALLGAAALLALILNPDGLAVLASALPAQGVGGWVLWLAVAALATAAFPALGPYRKSR